MHAELIAIGAELLLGEITDTNSAYIARALREVGVEVRWVSIVGDHAERITETVATALRRAPIIITTGGLGPTVDDPTRAAIARACGRELEYRPELWEQIVARFKRFGRTPGENNRQQAFIPQGALALENPVGTAPCFIVEHAGSALAALPGVPREMEHMLAHAVIPYLREKFSLTGIIRAKVLRTVGMGESLIDEKVGHLEKLDNPQVGLAAHAGQVDIRITATAPTEADALALIAPVEMEVRAALGDFVYGESKEKLEEVVARLLAARGETVAVAEAGAGGVLNARLAVVAEAAHVYGGALDVSGMDVPAEELARRAREQKNAEWGIGLSVNLRADKPIHVHITNGVISETRALGYGGPPALATQWASTASLNLLRLALLKNKSERSTVSR